MLDLLGCVAREHGAYERAKELLLESLRLYREAGDRSKYMLSALEDLAGVAALEGAAKRAAWLYGASEAWHEVIGAPVLAQERTELERYLAVARSGMSEAEWMRAWNEGRAMPLNEAMVVAEAYATE